MSETLLTIEPQPYSASSVYYALNKAPESAHQPLLGLYALHRKWREAANYADNHQAVTTLNWWHHELEAEPAKAIEHPALRALYAADWSDKHAEALQMLLHGHMHWHHLNRVEDLAQLQPTIDAIGGEFARLWFMLIHASVPDELIQSVGRALWWIDQIRHIGHNLSHQRIWIPMQWLKETDTPAHILLSTSLSQNRAQPLKPLLEKLIAHAQSELANYQTQYRALSKAQQKSIRSWHTLMNLRADLLTLIAQDPTELFEGLVSIAPLRKWWRAVRS